MRIEKNVAQLFIICPFYFNTSFLKSMAQTVLPDYAHRKIICCFEKTIFSLFFFLNTLNFLIEMFIFLWYFILEIHVSAYNSDFFLPFLSWSAECSHYCFCLGLTENKAFLAVILKVIYKANQWAIFGFLLLIYLSFLTIYP